jgi:hypothetical protein
MSWTADSTQITADQTCWTADGHDDCAVFEDGSKSAGPMGPGFFIFFQREIAEKTVLEPYPEYIGKDRRLAEDEEILLFVQLAVTYKLI